jgi:hypothetical protein
MIAERLAAARAELRVTTKEQIDADTAANWGARAVAAYEFYKATGDLGWLIHAAGYAAEAHEHASGGPPGFLERLRAELNALTDSRFP